MSSGERKWSRETIGLGIVCASTAFAYLLVFKLPGTPIYLENDSLIFLSDAQRIGTGEVMYRDFFQFTFPGIQVLYRSLFSIVGERYWILPALIIAISGATAMLTIALARCVSRGRIVTFAPALIFIFFGFRYYGLEGTHRTISPIIILTVLWLLLSRKPTNKVIATAGALCALTSFFTQQRGLALIAGIVLWLLLEKLVTRTPLQSFIGRVALLGVGFFAALIITCGYFAASVGVENFWYSTIVYPWLYYGAADQNGSPILLTDLAEAFSRTSLQGIIAAIAAALYGVVIPIAALTASALVLLRSARDWQAWRKHVLLALVWLALLLSTAGPSPIRLYQISAPALVLIFATFQPNEHFRTRAIMPAAASIALTLLAASQVWRTQAFWQYRVLKTPTGAIAFQEGPLADRYEWLLAHTNPGDSLYEARQPYVYFPLQLRNPTPMSQVWESDYTRPEQIDQVIVGLRGSAPKYVLWEVPYNKPEGRRSPGDHLAPLYEYLRQNYKQVPDALWTIEHGSQIEVWERVN
jgi:hypothetical protein